MEWIKKMNLKLLLTNFVLIIAFLGNVGATGVATNLWDGAVLHKEGNKIYITGTYIVDPKYSFFVVLDKLTESDIDELDELDKLEHKDYWRKFFTKEKKGFEKLLDFVTEEEKTALEEKIAELEGKISVLPESTVQEEAKLINIRNSEQYKNYLNLDFGTFKEKLARGELRGHTIKREGKSVGLIYTSGLEPHYKLYVSMGSAGSGVGTQALITLVHALGSKSFVAEIVISNKPSLKSMASAISRGNLKCTLLENAKDTNSIISEITSEQMKEIAEGKYEEAMERNPGLKDFLAKQDGKTPLKHINIMLEKK